MQRPKSSDSMSSSSSDDDADALPDFAALSELLKSLSSFADLSEALVERILSFIPTRRYAPMPKPIAQSSNAPLVCRNDAGDRHM